MRWPGCRCRGAFTLIELLVTVAIVALVMAVLLPALAGARKASQAVSCATNLRTIGQAVVLYANANRDYFPLSSHTSGSIAGPGAWLQCLLDGELPAKVKMCPTDEYRTAKLTSYATNDYLEPLTPGIDFNPVTGKTLPRGRTRALTRVTLVPRPTETIYAVETAGEGTVDHIHAVGWTRADQVAAVVAVTRHNGAANYLFVDGHARAVAWPRFRQSFSPSSNPFDPESVR